MPTYTPLQSIELTAATPSVIFSGIPQTYQDLILVVNCSNTFGATEALCTRFNGDSSSNYSATIVYGTGSSAASQRLTNYTFAMGGWNSKDAYNTHILSIQNYSNSTTNKTMLARHNDSSARFGATVSLWRSTSAITSVTLTSESGGNFTVGSTFDLYGISPVAANNAQAAGGTDIYYDASYVYHVFKGSGTFTPYRNLTADVLVVAGGGGAGVNGGGVGGGGGGAGGLTYYSSQSLTSATNYSVTVGAGGVGGTQSVASSNGSSSQFASLTASVGGGRGGHGQAIGGSANGGNGGSGGGAVYIISGTRGTAGTGTSGQGNNGGGSYASANVDGGGGGGGFSAVGETSGLNNGGNGGNGSSSYSSWGLATGTGQNVSGTYWYAGGGGGGGRQSGGTTAGSGGSGGGGSAAANGNGTSGITNTGGGGGGSGGEASTYNGGFGGSGIVIVRYAR